MTKAVTFLFVICEILSLMTNWRSASASPEINVFWFIGDQWHWRRGRRNWCRDNSLILPYPLLHAWVSNTQGYYYRPAKSSDEAEHLPLLSFFFNLPPFRFILKLFLFFQTLLVSANKIHTHIEVLLFSTSFDISVLFDDIKMGKIDSFCVTSR